MRNFNKGQTVLVDESWCVHKCRETGEPVKGSGLIDGPERWQGCLCCQKQELLLPELQKKNKLFSLKRALNYERGLWSLKNKNYD